MRLGIMQGGKGGRVYLQILAPLIQHFLQHSVDVGVQECRMSTGCGHGVVKDGTHWHAHHADVLGCISPLWRPSEDVVQDCEHVAVITDLLVASGVLCVWRLVWNLIPHLCEQHADARVRLDEVLELLQDGHETLWVVVDMFDLLLQPLLVHTAVRWHPTTRSRYC